MQPHKSRSWLNANPKDPQAFGQQVAEVCALYEQAGHRAEQGVHLVSTDEKTGMQALERLHPDLPRGPGRVQRREYEYKRHGTLCLTANLEVWCGWIIAPTLGPTRTEADFVAPVQQTVATDPEAGWVFIVDHLNTRWADLAEVGRMQAAFGESGLPCGPTSPRSAGCKPLSAKAAYAVWVAQACGIAEDLGTKGKGGVLKSQQSRAAFLSAEGHRIRLVYTPKHTSWLNQVEMGFSILVRKLLRRSSFTSVEDLKARILAFIDYFNRTMAKPIRWLYSAKPKPANGTGRSHPPMTDFQVGDRVRVRDLPSVTSYAGRTGEITWVLHTSDDLVYLYYVRLDRDSPNVFAASQATFRPDELEPETEPVR